MRSLFILLIVTHLAFLISPDLSAAPKKTKESVRIVSSSDREATISSMQELLSGSKYTPSTNLREVHMNFIGMGKQETSVSEFLGQLTKDEVLEKISQNYEPRGFVQRKRSLYLIYPFGAVKEGGFFEAQLGNEKYRIEVPFISEDVYVYRYQDAFLKIPYSPVDSTQLHKTP